MKKLLIVTYYWPPAGGPGVQRWLKFVKYLPEFGVEPIVYIPENPTYPIVDEKLLSEVSDQITILKEPIFEPYAIGALFSKKKIKTMSAGILTDRKKQTFLEKIALWVRGNLFIPDARKFWVKPSVKRLKKYIAVNGIETLVTTGPPHSLHLIGLHLKEQTGVKWIADFRDPWTSIGYHKELKLSASADKKHKKLESEVLTKADEIIVTSPTTASDFKKLTTKPVHLITNGYDMENVPNKPMDVKFSLAHIGSLLSERNPEMLWETLSELKKEIEGFADDLELKLIGTVSQQVIASIEKHGLKTQLELPGYMPHSEAVSAQRSSQLLLLIEIDSEETRSIIPGKLFEYLVSKRPILAIGPAGSDFASIIKETNTGIFVDYSQKAALKAAISGYYQEYKTGNLSVHPVGLQQYSRKQLTARLAELI